MPCATPGRRPGFPDWPVSEKMTSAMENGFYPEHPRATVDALGVKTSYYTAGQPDKETILLLHGMSGSADAFREMMHELADEYWLVAPDIPGFGYSENTAPYIFPHLIEWLAAFMEALELRPAHFGGHSFGGSLATGFALSYPGDVRSLILLAPAVLRPGKYPEWLRSLGKTAVTEKIMDVGTRVSASPLLVQRQARSSFYDPGRLHESVWPRRIADYERSRASGAVLRASALYDIRDELHQIQQRTCIIWGKHDPVLDPADAVKLSDMMPHSRTTLHLLPACGHVPQTERQDVVVEIVREFLDEIKG